MNVKGRTESIDIATLTDVVVERTIRDAKGAPLILSDVIDFETGRLDPRVLEHARGASEIVIAYDRVAVKKYTTAEELAELAERAKR